MKQKFNPPEHYWQIAKEYIIKKDKELQKEGKYYIDKKTAFMCVKIVSLLKHTDGVLADVNFQFSQWQIEAIVDIFGTKFMSGEYKGLRRYIEALIFIPKKNGKTELGAAFHIIMFFVDAAISKNQFCIASDKEQAMILHEAIETMIKSCDFGLIDEISNITQQPPRITKVQGAYRQRITTLSKPLGEEKDGKKVTFFTADEGHSHPNDILYKLINKGLSLCKEPLRIHLSTAGTDMQGYFYRDIYTYARKVKNGSINDERFYQVMFELPDKIQETEPDFWKKEKYWKMVNPAYPLSPQKVHMEDQVKKAEFSYTKQVDFMNKHLNMWVDKPDIWIKHNVWTANQKPIDEEELRGRICYGGLDLAKSIDVAAFVLFFPNEDGTFEIVTRFWIPKLRMKERVRRDKVPYMDWVKKGLMTTTVGNIIDDKTIRRDINDLREKFDIKIIGYDPWNSAALVSRLTEDGADMVSFRQGFVTMNPPTSQLEIYAMGGLLNHGNNEVLNWMCSNIVIDKDAHDNIKIDKKKSTEKVDGMVSLAIAIGIYLLDTKEKEEVNVYEERGLRIL